MSDASKLVKSYFVTVTNDAESGTFSVVASDIPGLEAKSTSLAELQKITYELMPTLVGEGIEPVITFDQILRDTSEQLTEPASNAHG